MVLLVLNCIIWYLLISKMIVFINLGFNILGFVILEKIYFLIFNVFKGLLILVFGECLKYVVLCVVWLMLVLENFVGNWSFVNVFFVKGCWYN